MYITELKRDKLHLTKITLSDGNEALIDNDVCSEKCLKKGMEIDSRYLEELIFESDYLRAKSRAIWYLDRADHTEKALYDKLIRAKFSKKASAKVIVRLKEVGLLDDNRYAENYANRLIESNTSKREALQKMLLKGVPYDLAKQTLEKTQTDELSQIKNVIEKKYRTKLNLENGVQKVYAALVRKGFSYSAVKTALSQYIEESEE